MQKLFGEYTYKILEGEEKKDFYKVFMEMRKEVFNDTFTIETDKYFSEKELDFFKTLKHIDVFRLPVFVYHKDKIIGWHIGFQKGPSFYMMNTGVVKEYQRKGIYTALLKEIVSIVKKKGFIDIKSHHLASNNKVIIPKLKAGFVITGMEIDETFGTLVNLKYYFNQKIKDVYLMRTGGIKPTDEMLKIK